jgi:branched-chain amino acid aminotransferase
LSKGKIKLIINFFDHPESSRYNFMMFFTEYSFPGPGQYKYGVIAILCSALRKDPNAKVLDTDARKTADEHIQESGVYEALLVERDGSVTEGSRSNLFAIKDGHLITPPDDSVLQGIARKKVVEICHENQIEIEFRKIHKSEFKEFEALFITGTSPKILPLKKVEDLILPVEHELLEFLMVKYNEKIEDYIIKR